MENKKEINERFDEAISAINDLRKIVNNDDFSYDIDGDWFSAYIYLVKTNLQIANNFAKDL